jgi:hypothetical protein
MTRPSFRKLKGYVFDPSFASTIEKRQTNEVIYKIRWENTTPGPVGEYIEVVDYDPTKECFYDSINLEENYVLADYGLSPSEGDPRFHQQQVYAVAMSVIEQFEKALGRKIIFSRLVDKDDSGRTEYSHEFVEKLRIYPHAMRQQNAYYSPSKVALLFGYFQAQESWTGNNVPGSAIFTCLSPDIVAHEMTHAILDSLHPYLRKDTNLDMPGFHEGFADIIALLHRFSFASVVEEQIRLSRGDLLSPENLLGDLAIQFGQSVSENRRALRSFLVENDKDGKTKLVQPDPNKYRSETEPHTRGGLLVAAVFDAFTRLYRFRAADLIRLASDGSGILEPGAIHPDLVKRLSHEACDIADKLMLICIRALDYCPPTDLTFGDYLRALITADVEHNPEDEGGLRFALMEAFRSWGIIPADINTYSVESLKWKPLAEYFEDEQKIRGLRNSIQYIFNPERPHGSDIAGVKENPKIKEVVGSMEKILREDDRRKIFNESQIMSAMVHEMFDGKFETYSQNMEDLLGMCFNEITYSFYDEELEQEIKLKAKGRDVFQVYKCRPVFQYNAQTGNTSKLLLITFLQKVFVDLARSPFEGYFPDDKYDFRGGATLIIDLTTFDIKYAIAKSIISSERLKQQLYYGVDHYANDDAALLMQEDEPFAALHIH